MSIKARKMSSLQFTDADIEVYIQETGDNIAAAGVHGSLDKEISEAQAFLDRFESWLEKRRAGE